tara:strand:- start:422 stop:826 length:405 start_codon:yes stop_codon:yes gene_type:complete
MPRMPTVPTIKYLINQFLVFFKSYWWVPIGLIGAAIFYFISSGKKKLILEMFNEKKKLAEEELSAAKHAYEEEIKINKAYNGALEKLAKKQNKSIKEIERQHKEKLLEVAIENRGQKDKMAKELAERYGLKYDP